MNTTIIDKTTLWGALAATAEKVLKDADTVFSQFQFQQALDGYTEVINLVEAHADNNKIITMLIRSVIGMGNCRRYLSKFKESVADFDKAIEYIKKRTTVNRTDDESARLSEEVSLDKSMSLTTVKFRDDLKLLANALWGKAESLRLLNDYDKALLAFEDAAIASQACGENGLLASSLWAKGNILDKAHKTDSAIEMYRQSFNVAKQTKDYGSTASALSGIANTLRRENRFEEAFPVCEEAIKFARISNNKMVYANALSSLGKVAEAMNKYEDAKRAYKGARDIGQQINYGHAIIEAKAGIRRIEKAEAESAKQQEMQKPKEHSVKTETQIFRVVDDKIERYKNDIYRIYGTHFYDQLENLDEDSIRSFMPDGRVWTTVLMCDIRGYTTAMSRADAEEQFVILNRYLSRGTEIINENGGGVDKYMGDAILAFFLPENVANPSERDIADTINLAIKTSFKLVNDDQLQYLFESFRSRYSDLGVNDFGLGVGIAVGYAKFGEIGSLQRREYTLIGRPVNLAARVQSASKTNEVFCTNECWGKYERIHEDAKIYQTIEIEKDDNSYKFMKGYENDKIVRITKREIPEPENK